MKIFCVVSHTHWDREWYQPFEVFRLRLVDLMDRCLELLKNSPEYIFHLDAQTIVLEDYLAVRTDKREELAKYIRQGRLIVGPWYLQNDFYLTSGEATVRNLLIGHGIAREFGACQKVGYAADQFGNITQLPQILADFGIHSFVFGRGYSRYEKDQNGAYRRKLFPCEFIWRGADGTQALAVNMTYWYNNAQRFPRDLKKALDVLHTNEKYFRDIAGTPYLLLMNGVDHLEAQDDLLPILEELDRSQEGGDRVCQCKLEDYIRQVQGYIDRHDVKLTVHTGELHEGSDQDILKGTLSSRTYLKTANVKAQNCLECRLEPLYALLELAGMKGICSTDHFRFMWKELLKNHPHDSICGCSVDAVHVRMEDQYARLADVFGEMLARGMDAAAEHMELDGCANENYMIVVANTTEYVQSGVVKATVDIVQKDRYDGISITDAAGRPADYAVLSRRQAVKDVYSPLNLPGKLDVDRYEVCLYTENINPFSFKGYLVKSGKGQNALLADKADPALKMENDRLEVRVLPNGQVDIRDKKSGAWLHDALGIEDTADCGDSYIYGCAGDRAVRGSDFAAAVAVLENNDFASRIEIVRDMEIPEYYDFENKRRSELRTVCRVRLELCLEKGARCLTVGYRIENTARDHRMRLVVRTGVEDDSIVTDIPFDIIRHKDCDHFPGTMSKVVPNASFALLEKERNGIAVFTEGLHEAEHLPDEKAIALTMARCTGVIGRAPDFSEVGGEGWRAPENQCIRTLAGKIGIFPYSGGYIGAEVPKHAKQFRNRPAAYFTSCDPRKFKVGRTTVQDTAIEDSYYLPDPYREVKIRDNTPLIAVDGTGIAVTALKKAEGGDGVVVRMVNLDEKARDAHIRVNGAVSRTSMYEQHREYLGKGELTCTLDPKKIMTLHINPDGGVPSNA